MSSPCQEQSNSLGLPPEILGLNALNRDDLKFIKSVYANFKEDLGDALAFLNPETNFLPKELKAKLEDLEIDFCPNAAYQQLTERIVSLLRANEVENLTEYILKAASLRKFLG